MTKLAIVHPTGLVAQEIRERLDDRPSDWTSLELLSTDDEEIGTLTEVRGSAAVVGSWEPRSLEGIDVAFLCGPMEANREILEHRPEDTRCIVASRDVDPGLGPTAVAGINDSDVGDAEVLVSPHPSVVLLAHLLAPLRDLPVSAAVATVLLPASVHGSTSLDDLLEQARSVLSFRAVEPSETFSRQVTFNLLPSLLDPQPILDRLGEVLGPRPTTALSLVQAGVFHGLATTVHLASDDDLDPTAVREALEGEPFVSVIDDPVPGPVEAAAEDSILVAPPTSATTGTWLWAVMDNLAMGGALNAIRLALD